MSCWKLIKAPRMVEVEHRQVIWGVRAVLSPPFMGWWWG